MSRRILVVAAAVLALTVSCTLGPGDPAGAPTSSPPGSPAVTSPGGVTGSAGVDGSAGPVPTTDSDRVCDAYQCISLSAFGEALRRRLQGRVVGYVALIGRYGVQASGQARTSVDPPQLAMSPNVPMFAAGVGQLYTTIAVLKSLAAHRLTVNAKIEPFLPPDWVRGPGVDTITFRELLSHHSGFRLDTDYVFVTPNAARDQIKEGIVVADKKVAQDSNLNFAVVRDLLPFLEKVPDPGKRRRTAAAGRFFTEYRGRTVFDPAGIGTAHCAPVVNAMLMYPTLTSLSGRGEVPVQTRDDCASVGPYLTPAQMRSVLTSLIDGDLLSATQLRLMDEECLGWECSLGEQTGFRGIGGSMSGDSGTQHTFSAIVLGRFPLVIAVNSDPTGTLESIVNEAMEKAAV
jgi:CubicO group peptidase (beta-lactamase class C family)